MSQNSTERLMREGLLKASPTETISTIIDQALDLDISSAKDWLDDLICFDLGQEKTNAIISVIEKHLIRGHKLDLSPYLALLYYDVGNHPMAQYYSEQVRSENILINNSFDDSIIRRFHEISKGYCVDDPLLISGTSLHEYNADIPYLYDGHDYSYSIHSFSTEIGRNMTLLKTRQGCIVFDCGAECSNTGTNPITEIELLEFFKSKDVGIDDIVAVIISHAHLDHYGSISSLLNIGIPIDRFFANPVTRKLIAVAAHDIPLLDSMQPIQAFFIANSAIRINSFNNGHILGSEGYVVSFDNINVVYTGDFCLHDQNTVKGLNPNTILDMDYVKRYGVHSLITETTYGTHSSMLSYKDSVYVFNHIIDKAIECGYKVFIPSFAIGRSQEVALSLNNRHRVLIDGLAIKLSQLYETTAGITIFNSNTRFNTVLDDRTHNFDCNDIIIASSGMLSENSTSASYLESLLGDDRKVSIVKTGYISGEAYGAELLERWRNASNTFFDVSLSAHADKSEIISLINSLDPENTITIHGNGLGANIKRNEAPIILATQNDKTTILTENLLKPDLEIENIDSNINEYCKTRLIQKELTAFYKEFPQESNIKNNELVKSDIFADLFRAMRLYPCFDSVLDQIRSSYDCGDSMLNTIYKNLNGM